MIQQACLYRDCFLYGTCWFLGLSLPSLMLQILQFVVCAPPPASIEEINARDEELLRLATVWGVETVLKNRALNTDRAYTKAQRLWVDFCRERFRRVTIWADKLLMFAQVVDLEILCRRGKWSKDSQKKPRRLTRASILNLRVALEVWISSISKIELGMSSCWFFDGRARNNRWWLKRGPWLQFGALRA